MLKRMKEMFTITNDEDYDDFNYMPLQSEIDNPHLNY